MRDIRSDLRERLEATVKQRNELNARVRALEAQEQRLRALLNDEEFSHVHQLPLASCPLSSEATGGARLREFVLGSLQDGHDWSLQDSEGARPRHGPDNRWGIRAISEHHPGQPASGGLGNAVDGTVDGAIRTKPRSCPSILTPTSAGSNSRECR